MPTTSQKVGQTLKSDDVGVARRKFIAVAKNFLDAPHNAEFSLYGEHNSDVLGFKGEGSRFWVAVEPFGDGFLKRKPKGETEVFLYFESDCDIQMHVEWSASITDPSGKELSTSQVFSTVFLRHNGTYENRSRVSSRDADLKSDVRMLEDPNFALHKDITKNGWLFDGALHLVVDVRFKVLEGGIKMLQGGNENNRAPVDPLIIALRSNIDSPIFPDFTLISADGMEIQTHKLIFTHQSPVFRAMFENNLEEARTGICKIEDASAASIKAMLAFLVGVEPKEWSFQLSRDLFKLGDKYQLTELRTRSAFELSKTLTTKNLVDILLLAYRHSESALLNETLLFLEDNIKKAAMDGVLVRLHARDIPEALFREWQAHWFRRQEGVEMDGNDEEMDCREDSE